MAEEAKVETKEMEGANGVKREREEEEEGGGENKQKSEEEKKRVEAEKKGPVSVGFKSFETSVEMFDYFYNLLHSWSTNLNINKYEHMMLLDLLQKGHLEPERKIGDGIDAFQIRFHPKYRSRYFFLIRNDESVDDFSFRKCVDNILPLPENMQIKPDVNKTFGGRNGGGRGGRGWRGRGGRGRGGKSRN